MNITWLDIWKKDQIVIFSRPSVLAHSHVVLLLQSPFICKAVRVRMVPPHPISKYIHKCYVWISIFMSSLLLLFGHFIVLLFSDNLFHSQSYSIHSIIKVDSAASGVPRNVYDWTCFEASRIRVQHQITYSTGILRQMRHSKHCALTTNFYLHNFCTFFLHMLIITILHVIPYYYQFIFHLLTEIQPELNERSCSEIHSPMNILILINASFSFKKFLVQFSKMSSLARRFARFERQKKKKTMHGKALTAKSGMKFQVK